MQLVLEKLPTINVYNPKTGCPETYAVQGPLTLDEISEGIHNSYGEASVQITLGATIGLLRKASYEK